MPCSAAIRATTGETNAVPVCARRCRVGPARLGGRGRRGSARGARRRRLRARRRRASALGSAAAPAPVGRRQRRRRRGASPAADPRERASRPSTVSPSCTRISWSDAGAGLGTSVSTLSVEISSSGSSAATVSPTFLSQRVIVPSETETPICGMTTSTTVPVATQYSATSRSAATTSATCGMNACSSTGAERYRRVGRGDALRRRVEILEGLLGDRRRDLGAEAAGVRVLVEDDHLRRLAHRREHGLLVPRQDRAQVDDLDRDVVAARPPPRSAV